MINLSESALKAVQKFKTEQDKADTYLRVGVKGGGCSGFSYDVQFVDAIDEKTDRVFDTQGVEGRKQSRSLYGAKTPKAK